MTKLQALAARPGTPDEGAAAQKKLDRLNRRYDWTVPDMPKEYLFAGEFRPARDGNALPVINLDDMNLATWIKWAIESATGIRCLFRGSSVMAEATPDTAAKLTGIGNIIASGFSDLWQRFAGFPTVTQDDRGVFLRGLYDGMMNDCKPLGEQLPQRAQAAPTRKAKRQAVGRVAGISLHPYAVATDLGRQIRFNVPLETIAGQLEQMKPKEIAQ